MSTVWLCAHQGAEPTDHDTEEAAMATAEELARVGKVAIVWPVEVQP